MPSVEIVTIGTELLLGSVLDSNSAHIGQGLASIGLDIYAKHAIGDNEGRIAATLLAALERSDGVITTGGLGPTVDDLTKEAVARVFDVPLELHEPSLAAMSERLARSGRVVSANNRRQALLPAGAIVLPNLQGTAPGFIAFRGDGRFVAALPGVPREMRAMLASVLLPWLREHFGLRGGIVTRTLHTVGMPESEVDARIDDLFRQQENPKIAMLAQAGFVDIKLMAKVDDLATAARLLDPLEETLRERLGSAIFGVDAATLESLIIAALRERKQTIAFAESCTGGALTAALVQVPGASTVLRGGMVAYANDLKEQCLGVSPALLQEHGAVSEACALAMAAGVLARCGANIALATTGIAGPDGGSAEKPVGTVYIAFATDRGRTCVRRYLFAGERAEVRARTVVAALSLLLGELRSIQPSLAPEYTRKGESST